MVQIQLISRVIEWERRLEFTEERRNHRRPEPYRNYLAAPKPNQKESKQPEEEQAQNFTHVYSSSPAENARVGEVDKETCC